jgi:hypothetical protein
MQLPIQSMKVGEKFTFQWQPGYRGALRDGERVYVLAIEEQSVKVQYRLKHEESLRFEHLYR